MKISQSDFASGVQWAAGFLVALLLLGYPKELSFLLAIAGGIAGATLTSGWNDRTLPDKPPSIFPSEAFSRFGTEEPPHHISSLAKRQASYRRRTELFHRGRPMTWWERIWQQVTLPLPGSPESQTDDNEAAPSDGEEA